MPGPPLSRGSPSCYGAAWNAHRLLIASNAFLAISWVPFGLWPADLVQRLRGEPIDGAGPRIDCDPYVISARWCRACLQIARLAADEVAPELDHVRVADRDHLAPRRSIAELDRLRVREVGQPRSVARDSRRRSGGGRMRSAAAEREDARDYGAERRDELSRTSSPPHGQARVRAPTPARRSSTFERRRRQSL